MQRWWSLLLVLAVSGCLGGGPTAEPEPDAPDLAVSEACDTPLFPGIRGREVDVAVDPNDRSRVAAIAMVTPPGWTGTVPSPYDLALWTGLARSFDGGQTWQTTILPNWPGDTEQPVGPFSGGAALGDGIVGFAPDGDLYVSAILLTGLMQYNMVSMRFAGDSLEPTDVTVFSRGAYGDQELNDVPGFNPVAYNDKQDQAIDPESGGWYVSWMWRSNARGMNTVPVVSYSPDGGVSWEGPVMLVDALGAGLTSDDAHLAPAPIILGDSVLVLWTKVGSDAVWAARAPRDTLDFGEPYPVASLGSGGGGASNVLTLPMINVAVGPGPGGVGQRAWLTAIRGGDGYDVGVWYSDDGTTWQGPLTPHADTANDQMIPTVAVAPDGRVAVQFIDFSDDPDNTRYHLVEAVTADGAGWDEVRLTSEPTDTAHAGDAVQGHVGDYFGNGWTSAGLLGAWQDGRDGTADESWSEIYTCLVPDA